MALITWNPSYSVNVKEMDDHHQKLVEIINDLHDAMKVGKGKDQMGSTLDELINYTRMHFSSEEKLMQKCSYAGLADQVAAHKEFVRKVSDFRSDLAAGKLSISFETMSFLRDWLLNHINGADKKYGPVLNSQGIK